jgi:hypothetical protein
MPGKYAQGSFELCCCAVAMTLCAAVRVQKVLRSEVGRIGPQRVSLLILPCLIVCCRVELEQSTAVVAAWTLRCRDTSSYVRVAFRTAVRAMEDGSTVGAANGL